MQKLNIRSHTWLNAGTQLSWVFVIQSLGIAFEELGHNFLPVSTNGYEKSIFSREKILKSSLELESLRKGNVPIDIDITYTVPSNFSQRFLSNSKAKCAIYNYETFNPNGNGWIADWKKHYHLVDYYFPSSNFSAEIFVKNGIPEEKVFVIPHGVDTKIFNQQISKIKLKTKKSFKFCSVVAPHFRKNIDTLLEAYCRAFTNKDDVCLVLKTKVYKYSDGIFDVAKNPNGRKGFEIVIGDIFKELYKKFGSNMPEIEIIDGHVDNIASIYTASDCHISTTSSECFGLPMLESQACGILNIAPRYSAMLDFLNDGNSLLIDTGLREAKKEEQYWGYNKGSLTGKPSIEHTIELMRKAVREKETLSEKFKSEMEKTVKQYSWKNAAQMIIDAVDGKLPHYKQGTYDLMNQHKKK